MAVKSDMPSENEIQNKDAGRVEGGQRGPSSPMGSREEFRRFFNKDPFFVMHQVDSDASTDYGVFFIAPWAVELIGFFETHEEVATDGGAVTLQLEKLTPGQALDAYFPNKERDNTGPSNPE